MITQKYDNKTEELSERIKKAEKLLEEYYLLYVKGIDDLLLNMMNLKDRIEKLETEFTEIKECMLNFSYVRMDITKCENKIKEIESTKFTQELNPQVWKFLTERIDKLEEWKGTPNDQESMPIEVKLHKMQMSIDFIFESIKKIESRADHISDWANGGNNIKRPHKCPVCNGCGHDKGVFLGKPENFSFEIQYSSCTSCEARGIVWG